MKATTFKVKNTLEGISSRLAITEEKISKLEDTVLETVQNETQKHILKKTNRKCDTLKSSNMCITSVPQGRGEKHLNNMNAQIQESQ